MKALQGATVLVTRPRRQAAGLAGLLRRSGARVRFAPTVRTAPAKSRAALDSALRDLDGFDIAVFTSVNGVAAFFSRARKLLRKKPPRPRGLWAIGPATAAALARHGWDGSRIPPAFTGEALAEAMEREGLRGRSVLIPRAAAGRDLLPLALRRAGARVVVAPAYSVAPDPAARRAVRDAAAAPRVDWITFTSPSTVEGFLEAGGEGLLRRAKAAAIGPVTAEALRRRGIEPAVTAARHTAEGLARAMSRWAAPETTDSLQATLLDALHEGGAMLRKYWGKARWGYKGRANLITEADHASEARILDVILGRYPRHGFITEERSPRRVDSDYVWTIDPLDGTTNYAHRNPVCCVSIGLSKKGRPFAAGVYDPFRDETFLARRGCGAFLNGEPIRVSEVRDLRESLLLTGFAYDRAERSRFYLEYYRRFMELSHDVRRSGSAALDLAWTAAGRVDGFWEFKLSPWDVAAGWLLVTEAGGRVTDFSGREWSRHADMGAQTLATNGKLHGQMLRVIA